MSEYRPYDHETQARTGVTERLRFAASPIDRTIPPSVWAPILIALILILLLTRMPQPEPLPAAPLIPADNRVCVIAISSCN